MEKLKMHSPDMTQENIARIRGLFPNCVTEAYDDNGEITLRVDFDLLRQELSDSLVEGPQERYRLDWPGKRQALLTANAPIAKTLRPCREESVDFDTTKNLYIEGDNLDALKLLQESYLGKVKMIYIDPPYNRQNDYLYKDDFSESTNEYLLRSNQNDEYGNRLIANTESNGKFHSDWLTMLYSRLRVARNLLKNEGVIFISIANDEFVNLKKVCDEVFGESNFVECITWNKRIPKNDKGIGNIHDFILIYVKDSSLRHEFFMRKDGLEEIYELVSSLKKKNIHLKDAEGEIKKLYKKNGYDRGITLYNSLDKSYRLWGKINMSWPNATTFGPRYEVPHPKTGKPVKIPDRGWRWKQETFDEASLRKNGKYTLVEELHDGSFRCGKIWFAPDEKQQPSSITYLDEVNDFLLRSILSFKSDGGIEVENIFEGKNYFSYPKPTSLMRALIASAPPKPDDIVLDFFSGSATTAHAVMQLNAEDGGNRQFIMVQLPEVCDDKSEAFKSGYETIADIGKERIRRAGKKILEGECHPEWNKDIGFRVLKIDTSCMEDVYYTPDQIDQKQLSLFADNIKADRRDKPEDLLYQVLIDWGVELHLPIRTEKIQGKQVFFVDDNALAACFDSGISEAFIQELAKHKPLRVVFRDAGFASDAARINAEQIFKQLSPSTEVKVI
ncbi:site-specific DNA-methyltransferase [Bilophila wadsworthia]|uniref:site-specific DNA-methyltransferase n=1 Tax=Bilophila wadsworthia TaxID=35833 RepID=UPI001D0A3C9A|nr:site-specific DNA-methyltransferase [Bilophila wadsworthia]MCB8572417.1 site-specific DNA-methyltransferase [Bilophila wadsworthia]MCC2715646.1 site-specific DNA-methyltransferase [Bilophila wadsworthia]